MRPTGISLACVECIVHDERQRRLQIVDVVFALVSVEHLAHQARHQRVRHRFGDAERVVRLLRLIHAVVPSLLAVISDHSEEIDSAAIEVALVV